MRQFWIIIGFLMLCGGLTFAQTGRLQTEKKVHFDRQEGLSPVQLDKEQIESYKKDKDFNYSRKLDVTNWWEAFTSWLDYVWNSFWQTLFGDLQAGSWLGKVLYILKYVVILGIIGLAVWLFVKLNPGRAFMTPKASPEVLLSEEEEIINDKNIPKLIESALSQGDYRLAIRYYYLLMLKILKDCDMIDYQDEKTNDQYNREIADSSIADQFRELTYLYDFIWYGDFSVNQHQFDIAKLQFVDFQNYLNQRADV